MVVAQEGLRRPRLGSEKFAVNNYNDAYAGVDARWPAPPRTPTTRCSPRSGSRSGTKRIARLARADGHPHAGLAQLRDDARRPQAGRDAARHGPRVRDVRRNGKLVYGTLSPGTLGTATVPARSASARSGADDGKLKAIELPTATQARNRSRPARARRERRRTRRARSSRASSRAAPASARCSAAHPGGRQDRHDRELRRRLVRRLRRTTYTVAVWVGYPDKLKPMKTEFHGEPVAGGTFPAEIWHDFMTSGASRSSAPPERQGRRDAAGAPHERDAAPGAAGHAAPRPRRHRPSAATDAGTRGRPTARDDRAERQRRPATRRRQPPSRARTPATAGARPPRQPPSRGPAPRRPAAPAAAPPRPDRLAASTSRSGRAARSPRRGHGPLTTSGARPRRSATAARPPW